MKRIHLNTLEKNFFCFSNIQQKFFSQTTRNKAMLNSKVLKQINHHKNKLKQNKVFEGMNSNNTNELAKIKDLHFYPIQHPKNINFNDTNIISYKPPVQNLTEYNRIHTEALKFENPKFESPLNSKALDIAILGPPNAGKSSLMNK